MPAGDIITKCNTLSNFWLARKKKFEDWYRLLTMYNENEQSDMESFVGNDPRTFWNMSKFLLTPRPMTHRIPIDVLTRVEATMAAGVEEQFTAAWNKIDKDYRKRGRLSWWDEFIGNMILLGWYSVFCIATTDELIAEVWNPAQVFPMYGETGLIECAHIYPLSPAEANKLVREKDWNKPSSPFTSKVSLYDYYYIDDNGEVVNSVVVGNHIAKDNEVELSLAGEIPVIVGPVGGISDFGAVSTGNDWKENLGQGLFATNEKVYKSSDRQKGFEAQMIRDTAEGRWIVKSRVPGLVKPQDIFKRGAVFEMSPDEDMYSLPVNPIPVELRGQLMELEGMKQRGSLSWLLYGNILQEISAYTMSQVANSAQQVLDPFYQATMNVPTEIDNRWLRMMKKNNLKPYGFELPANLPEYAEFEATYKISIPGDFLQRANAARMLSPDVKFSKTTIMELMFPEIKDPIKEVATANADDAQMHPLWRMIDLIRAFEEQAVYLTEFADTEGAKLFKTAANAIKAEMMQTQAPAPTAAPGGAAPPETALPEELGKRRELPKRGLSPIA